MQIPFVNFIAGNSDRPFSPVGYGPSDSPRRVIGSRPTHALALVLPRATGQRASDPFMDRFVAGVTEEAATRGFALALSREDCFTDEQAPYQQLTGRHHADGFFVVRTTAQDVRIKILQAQGVPFVVYGRTLDGSVFPHVDIDSEHGMRKMVDHLVGFGHTRIAGIVGSTELTESIQRRYGLEAALRSRGAFDPSLIVESQDTRQDAYSATRKLLRQRQRPTAVVCNSDLVAVGACAAVADEGLVVGKDVSVGGFDDAFGDDIHPGLTTVCNPAHDIGAMLCRMLMEIVAGRQPDPRQVVLEPELVVRQSTGPVACP